MCLPPVLVDVPVISVSYIEYIPTMGSAFFVNCFDEQVKEYPFEVYSSFAGAIIWFPWQRWHNSEEHG